MCDPGSTVSFVSVCVCTGLVMYAFHVVSCCTEAERNGGQRETFYLTVCMCACVCFCVGVCNIAFSL